MREINQFDSFAMEAVAEILEDAAGNIRLTGFNHPQQHEDSTTALDLHVESARVWAGAVLDRLESWAERARRIAAALERHELRAT
jgi:hypothetical protein